MIGIVCGGGTYPHLVIKACQRKKLKFCLLLLENFEERDTYPNISKLRISMGKVDKILSFFRANDVDKLVFAGDVKRPKLSELAFDSRGISWLVRLWVRFWKKGDNSLLTGISELFLKEGIEVISGTSFINEAFMPEGIFSDVQPTKKDQESIDLGIREAKLLGINDIGQSVVVSDGKIIGREDKMGTDALIGSCYEGILIKLSKPQQDERLDLPTIGVETIENLHRHGFKGLVIEAGKTIVLDKNEVIRKVNEYKLFFQVVEIKRDVKVFIMAGEASGDYLGGRLMNSIRRQNPAVEFVGTGGQCMEQAGLVTIFSIAKLSIIGIWEVIGKIFHVKKLIKRAVEVIEEYKPDVIIGIDSSGFTHRVYKAVKKKGYKIPIVHYVAPPVWAWRSWRAKKLHKFIDKLLVLFPFEKEIFAKYGLPTVFVGHPVVMDKDFTRDESIKNPNELVVTLLPGSRPSEIKKHMPIFKKFMELMNEKHPGVQFFLPAVRETAALVKEFVDTWSIKPIVSTKKLKKIKAYNLSDVAVAASGTVTLELTKMNLPFVTIYSTSGVTYFLVKWLIRIPYVCLTNILAQKTVVPELLQKECTAENIFTAVEEILKNPEEQKSEFRKIISQLETDPEMAGKEVLNMISK